MDKNSLEKVYKENLFIMRLLVTYPKFIDDIFVIRKKIKIPENGFSTKRDKNKWAKGHIQGLPSGDKYFRSKKSLFYHAENVVKKYNLKYNFLPYVENYILFGKVDAPKYNFDISVGPNMRGFTHDKFISIKAYSPLTKAEIREATKELLKLQKEFLSSAITLDLRPRVDIDRALEIEKEMEKRYKKIEVEYTGYLKELHRNAKKSIYYKREFDKWKKLRKNEIEKKIEKYTSKKISERFFGTEKKHQLVRKICSKLKEKRKQLFV